MRFLSVLYALPLLFGTFPAASAQDTPITIRTSTRLVLLDASAVDAKGTPIPGLTAKDFAVFEDGKQQRISTFDVPEAHVLPPAVDRNTHFDEVPPANFGSSPVTVLVLDEVNTHFSDSAYGVHSLLEYLQAQPETLREPTELLAVRDSRFEQISPYTLDRDALVHALRAHKPEQAWQLEQSMSAGEGVGVRLARTISALEQVVQNSARIPGHKNIVWVGVGFPNVDIDALTPGTERELNNMLRHVTDIMLSARGSLYAIDPTTTAASQTEITDPSQLEFAIATGGAANMLDPFNRSLSFDRIGPVTGGRIVRQRNDVSHLVDTSVVVGSTYYTLGYRPTNQSETPGKFRHIRVQCLRPGCNATTHDGYYSSRSTVTSQLDTIGYDLDNAATAALPFTGIAFSVDRDQASPARDRTGYLLHVIAPDLTWHDGLAGQTATVQVLVVALSAKNRILGHTLHSETATADPGVDTRQESKKARFAIDLKVPAKTARLRFIVRDSDSGKMGTKDLKLTP